MSGGMKVLVTGGSGMIGRSIADEVASCSPVAWTFLSSKDADLTDFDQTVKVFEKAQPTHVLHLAANVGGLYKNMSNNLEMFRSNFAINDNVLRAAHQFGVKKVISCLSTCIFPDNTSYPLTEEMVHLGPPHDSNYGYSYAKPLIHKAFLAKRDKTDLVVFGTGAPLRQFTYSRDLARLMIWALTHYEDTEPLILSVGEEDEITIDAAAKAIAETMGFTGSLKHDTAKADGQFKKTASNAKLKSLYLDFQFTPFSTAVRETCDWFVANFDQVRK